MIETPCVKVCVMDPQHGLCRGCFRTLDEIARWGAISDAEREAVMRELAARRAASDVAEIPVPPLA